MISWYFTEIERGARAVFAFILEMTFAFTSRSDIQMDSDEIIFVEFLLPKTKPITVGTAYRPPKQNDFLNNFKDILTHLRTDCEIIILGDFNICGLHRSSSIFKSYANILKLF